MNNARREIMRRRVKLLRAVLSVFRSTRESCLRDLCIHVNKQIRSNTEEMVAFSADDPKIISYAAKPMYKWDNDRRVKTTLGKYVRRNFLEGFREYFGYALTDELLKTFTEKVCGTQADPTGFSLLDGRDLMEAYRRSIGASSCMTDSASYLVDLYAKNPHKVCLVVYRSRHDSGRALLWLTDEGKVVLDRIYPNEEGIVDAFQAWANSVGATWRVHNRYVGDDLVDLADDKAYSITLNVSTVSQYPFIDTFFYGSFNRKLLPNGSYMKTLTLSNEREDGDNMFHSTSGHYNQPCCQCGRAANTEWNDEPYCDDCVSEGTFICDRCDERYCDDELNNVNDRSYCDDCFSEIFTNCEHCGEAIRREDAIETIDTHNLYCTDCAGDRLVHCDYCDSYYEEESDSDEANGIHECESGVYRCQHCSTQCNTCEDTWIAIPPTILREINRGLRPYNSVSIQCHDCHEQEEEEEERLVEELKTIPVTTTATTTEGDRNDVV